MSILEAKPTDCIIMYQLLLSHPIYVVVLISRGLFRVQVKTVSRVEF